MNFTSTDVNITILLSGAGGGNHDFFYASAGLGYPYTYSGFTVPKSYSTGSGTYRIDEIYRFFDISYTNTTPTSSTGNFTITAIDKNYGQSILNFSAIIVNTTGYEFNYSSDNGGKINTTIPSNTSSLFNITLSAPDHYSNYYYNRNISENLQGNLTSFRNKINVTAVVSGTSTIVSNFSASFMSLNSSDLFELNTTNGTLIGRTLWNETYNITVSSQSYSTSTKSQIALGALSVVNFTLFEANKFYLAFIDEITNSLVNDRNISVEVFSTPYAVNTSTVNGYLNFSNVYPANYTIRYSANNYIQRFYYAELTNKSYQNLTLFMLSNTTGTPVPVLVYDQTNQLKEGVTIKLKKYNILTNSYELKEMVKTNFEGKAIINPVLNAEYYKFTLEYGGDVVLETEPTYIYSTDTLQFTIVIGEAALEGFYSTNNVDGNLTFNNVTNKFRFTYNDPTNSIYGACLVVYEYSRGIKTTLNSTCIKSVSATMLNQIYPTNGSMYEAFAYIKSTSSSQNLFDSILVSFEAPKPRTKGALFFVGLMTIIFLFLAIWDLRIAMVMAPLPTVLCSFMGLIDVDRGIAVGILALGMLIAWQVRK